MAKAHQLDRNARGWRGRKYCKRVLAKIRRRAERRNLENAGTRMRDFMGGYV